MEQASAFRASSISPPPLADTPPTVDTEDVASNRESIFTQPYPSGYNRSTLPSSTLSRVPGYRAVEPSSSPSQSPCRNGGFSDPGSSNNSLPSVNIPPQDSTDKIKDRTLTSRFPPYEGVYGGVRYEASAPTYTDSQPAYVPPRSISDCNPGTGSGSQGSAEERANPYYTPNTYSFGGQDRIGNQSSAWVATAALPAASRNSAPGERQSSGNSGGLAGKQVNGFLLPQSSGGQSNDRQRTRSDDGIGKDRLPGPPPTSNMRPPGLQDRQGFNLSEPGGREVRGAGVEYRQSGGSSKNVPDRTGRISGESSGSGGRGSGYGRGSFSGGIGGGNNGGGVSPWRSGSSYGRGDGGGRSMDINPVYVPPDVPAGCYSAHKDKSWVRLQ